MTYEYATAAGEAPATWNTVNIYFQPGGGATDAKGATRIDLGGNTLTGGSATFATVIGHEFGHIVACANDFAQGPGADHYSAANQRTLGSNNVLTEAEQGVSFREGWADYFAVQAVVSTGDPLLNMNSMLNLRDGNFEQTPLEDATGYGEDNDFSVAGTLWHLANDKKYSQFCSGPQQLFQILATTEK